MKEKPFPLEFQIMALEDIIYISKCKYCMSLICLKDHTKCIYLQAVIMIHDLIANEDKYNIKKA